MMNLKNMKAIECNLKIETGENLFQQNPLPRGSDETKAGF